MIRISMLLLLFMFVFSCSARNTKRYGNVPGQVVWNIDNLTDIGGNTTEISGSPKIVDTPGGKAVEFDGVNDGIIVDKHPLEGAEKFTLEVIFRPDPDGLAEQRFFHLQENGGDNRLLIETRLTEDNKWYIDTFMKSGETNQTLKDEKFTHPVGEWFNATLVFDGSEMRHYVNGVEELSASIEYFKPHLKGKTSIGVRINKVYWFKGAIRKARFTPWVLSPGEFLKP